MYRRLMMTGPEIIWRLQGDALKNIVCVRRATNGQGVLLQIVADTETVLDEIYPDVGSATFRAEFIRENLLKNGWLQDTTSSAHR